jgi:hypothetical protein
MSWESITKVLDRKAKAPRIDDQTLVANIQWRFLPEFYEAIFHQTAAVAGWLQSGLHKRGRCAAGGPQQNSAQPRSPRCA